MLQHLLRLKPQSRRSLQLQLRQQLSEAIMRGNFPLKTPLPSSRKLAKQLGVARNTVVLAYEHLEDDGYLIAHQRRGYFINPEILKGRADFIAKQTPKQDKTPPDWQRLIKSQQMGQRNIEKPSNWQSYQYPFIYGQFDNRLFPTQKWRECCRDSVRDGEIRDWASDHFINDDPMLINEIRTRILPRRGIWVDPEQIMITVGTQQGLYILTKLLLDQHSTMGIENPGYTDVRNIARLHNATIKPLAIDHHGLLINNQLNDCNCIYVTPSHQSPTTVTLPLPRREQLLAQANEHDFIIIEDDYESQTSFQSAHLPALKSFDEHDRVIYAGSFSKILAPGLRLGYIVGAKEIIQEAIALRRLMVRHPPANNQRAVALFIARGYYDTLATKALTVYEQRWQAMGDALNTHLPESSKPPSFGGSSYWVRGPENLNTRQLHTQALKRSIIIEPGDIHFLNDSPPMNYFRLGYSSIDAQHINNGIEILAGLVHEMT